MYIFPFRPVSESKWVCPIFRVLMSSIRNLGGCPCPRCKILLSDVHLLGTKMDRRKRRTLARVDDNNRRYSVARARSAIYEPKPNKCLAVDSAYVERQLKQESLVPTSVSLVSICIWTHSNQLAIRMLFQNALKNLTSICSVYFL